MISKPSAYSLLNPENLFISYLNSNENKNLYCCEFGIGFALGTLFIKQMSFKNN